MVWLPSVNDDTGSPAWPPTNAAVSSATLPPPVTSVKLTVPVGAAPVVEVAVAINSTVCPKPAGFTEKLSARLVGAWVTVCVMTMFPGLKDPLPE